MVVLTFVYIADSRTLLRLDDGVIPSDVALLLLLYPLLQGCELLLFGGLLLAHLIVKLPLTVVCKGLLELGPEDTTVLIEYIVGRLVDGYELVEPLVGRLPLFHEVAFEVLGLGVELLFADVWGQDAL